MLQQSAKHFAMGQKITGSLRDAYDDPEVGQALDAVDEAITDFTVQLGAGMLESPSTVLPGELPTQQIERAVAAAAPLLEPEDGQMLSDGLMALYGKEQLTRKIADIVRRNGMQ